MSKNCYLCGSPTQNPERIHTPCLYAFLAIPRVNRVGNEVARLVTKLEATIT
jgi:hypothetical protein